MSDKEKIIQANTLRYASGDVVNNYLLEDYHKVRINIAIGFLNDSFDGNKKKIKILEIASGDGTIAKKIKEYGYDVWATDITTHQLQDICRYGIHVAMVNASEVFPFDSGSFDCVFAGDIIEHIFDVDSFLSECYRVLKPRGRIIITTPNLASLQDRFRFFVGLTPKQIQPCHEFYKLHIRPFTLQLLNKTLESYGFLVKRVSSNFVIWKIGKHYLIYSRRLAKLFPGIGRSLIVYGEKTKQ